MKRLAPILFGTIILFFTSSDGHAWGKPGCVRFDILCKLTGKGASTELINKKETKESKSIETSHEGVTISRDGHKTYKGRILKPNGCVKFDILCNLTGKGAIHTESSENMKKQIAKKKKEKELVSQYLETDTELNAFGGMFDFSDVKQKAALIGFQHQNDELFRETFLGKVSPITGGFLTENSALYVYTGIQWEYDLGFLRITPSFAPGYYHIGDGKDLGHPLEFKSELQFT